MNATDLKRLASLSEWKDRVAECRSSGLKVREWCKMHEISPQTYYRWERCVLAAASGQLQTRSGSSCTAVSASPMFAELPQPKSAVQTQRPESVVATIRYESVSIDLYAGAEPGFIVALCKELQYAQ